MNKKHVLVASVLFLMFTGCSQVKKRKLSRLKGIALQELPVCEIPIAERLLPESNVPITILIHGTRGLTSIFPQMPFETHNMIRHNGISRVIDLSNFYFFARIARNLSNADPEMFPIKNFYLFGWSGDLSFSARKRAARRLFAFINTIRSNEKYHATPITVISHSHGGNVVLNVASVVTECNVQNFWIDQVILLSSPVQSATAHFIHDPIFKKVYSFFSRADLYQVLDPQGIYATSVKGTPLFSQRTFDLGKNLKQIMIKKNSYSPSHIDFISSSFIKALPSILRLLEDENKRNSLTMYSEKNIYCIDYLRKGRCHLPFHNLLLH